MTEPAWKPDYTERADRFWAEYQKTLGVTDRMGQALGVDPLTGKIWFGTSILDMMDQHKTMQQVSPLFYLRAGRRSCDRVGSCRC